MRLLTNNEFLYVQGAYGEGFKDELANFMYDAFVDTTTAQKAVAITFGVVAAAAGNPFWPAWFRGVAGTVSMLGITHMLKYEPYNLF